MMEFSCPYCNQLLECDDSMVERALSCHSCQREFTVPSQPPISKQQAKAKSFRLADSSATDEFSLMFGVVGGAAGYAIDRSGFKGWKRNLAIIFGFLLLFAIAVSINTYFLMKKQMQKHEEKRVVESMQRAHKRLVQKAQNGTLESDAGGQRMAELSAKAFQMLSKAEFARALELHSIPIDRLSPSEGEERIRLNSKAISLLPKAEQEELQNIGTKMFMKEMEKGGSNK